MIVTDDDDLADRCRRLRNLAFRPGRRFVHDELGWNYRMTNLQAALGLAQLSQVDELLRLKQAIGLRYLELLADARVLQLPLRSSSGSENVFWVFGVVIDEATGHDAETMMERLAIAGIGSRPFFFPLHLQPVLRSLGFGLRDELPTAERIARQGLYIPSSARLTESQVERVATELLRALQ
jgi:perosamine synthetase